MAKETFYFPHDYNARNDLRLQALVYSFKAEGYGIYWCIIEILHEEADHFISYSEISWIAIAKQMGADVEQVLSVVSKCLELGLLQKDGDQIRSPRVCRNIEKREHIRQIKSEAGKKSAEARQKATGVQQPPTGVQHDPTKESKGKEKEKKDLESFNVFWFSYHSITGLPKTDRAPAFKHWQKLNQSDHQKALDNIQPFFNSLPDPQYCKKARTYLADENYNDEFGKREARRPEQPTIVIEEIDQRA